MSYAASADLAGTGVGWTTAIVVAVVRRIHFGEEPERLHLVESSNKQRHLEEDVAE